ncbi:MAG: phage holin family protein [Planctomycetaceae bacterium]|nr:phage holin family protein [Planctomycetaceae bacterium]
MTDFPPVLEEPLSSPTQPSMSTLLSGIVSDVRDLLEQQFALIRHELQQDMHKTCRATWMIAVGACSALIAGIGLFFAGAHGLSWAFPDLPLWGSLALMGLLLVIVAGGMIYRGIREFDSVTLRLSGSFPAIKEN